MSKGNMEKVTDAEIQRLLEETQKQYEVYSQLTAITSIVVNSVLQEDYDRDMKHPLSLQIKG